MSPRPSLVARGCVLALFLAPAAGAVLGACGDDTVLLPAVDGGGKDGTTVEASVDSGTDDSTTAEASCAVDAGPLDDAQVALGQALVGTHKCTSCHGDQLSGNKDGVPSPTAEGGTAYPPNLTSDPATGLGCWTNEQIENAMLNGIDNEGMALCAPMPQFGHLAGDAGLTAAQAQSVVAYLRSLAIVSNQVPDTPDCPVPAPEEAGTDAGGNDAATDAGPDGAADAGNDAAANDAAALDGSADAGSDASVDATQEAAGEAGESGSEAGDDGGGSEGGD